MNAFAWLVAAVVAIQVSGAHAEDEAARVHTVAPGETLWQIAASTIGDATLWPALYLANRDQIKDPARVYPGQQLAIPEIAPDRHDAIRREALEINQP